MKKLCTLLLFALISLTVAQAQRAPRGMNYQAVARDLKGQVLADQTISLRINLLSGTSKTTLVHYSEAHDVTTNQFGLFTLVIGAGKTQAGNFDRVPWSTDDIWLEVGIREAGKSNFAIISSSKLLAVPYAFHAATAAELVGKSGDPISPKGDVSRDQPGVVSQNWSLFGNMRTNPDRDFLGTTDAVDLVFITSNIERLRITKDGAINLKNDLEVGDDLVVKKNVNVNTTGGTTTVNGPTTLKNTLDVDGATELNSTLNVDGLTKVLNNTQSNSSSTGALVVTGGVGIGQNLNVGGAANFGGSSSFGGALNITDATQSTSTTTGALKVAGGVGIVKNLNVGGNEDVDGSLNVDGVATLKSTMSVDGATDLNSTLNADGATTLKSTLGVDGATDLNSTLNADGATTLKSTVSVDGAADLNSTLNVDGTTSLNNTLAVATNNGGYMASFTNTNDGDGDGLKIKLGKTHPAWNGSAYLEAIAPNIQQLDLQIEVIRGWIYNGKSFQVSDLANLAPGGLIVGSTISITNVIIDKINSSLGLPISIGPYGIPATTLLPGFQLFPGVSIAGSEIVPALNIPSVNLPAFNVVPKFDIVPKIPNIPDFGFPTMTLPVISGTDVTNSLTKKNEFIAFNDKDDRNLGAIRAQSVVNFSTDYIDGLYLTNLTAALIGLDIVKDILSVFSEFANLADAYNSIGVEYASGHGDYAEWLERSNPDELISAGDIVGVKGGKITKDLRDAEQIMAVSYRPIVLGNTPPAGKEGLGNKIAFMGQIPVKVMGPVKTGDYIVAKSNITGYGVAISPADMTADDFRLVVGRSWEANLKAGPKAVNTLVGVHNGDYMKLIKKQQEKLDGVDARLTALEMRLNRPSDTPAQREKKAVASSKK